MHKLDFYTYLRFISFNTIKYYKNKPHIHLRACDAASSHHCPPPITGSKIPIWDFISNYFYDFPRFNEHSL